MSTRRPYSSATPQRPPVPDDYFRSERYYDDLRAVGERLRNDPEFMRRFPPPKG